MQTVIDYNPRLESIEFDYKKWLASGASVEEAKEKFDHIELNTPEGDLAHIKIIRQTAGYFVYDLQTENVFDPLTHDFEGLASYQSMAEQVEKLRSDKKKVDKKP